MPVVQLGNTEVRYRHSPGSTPQAPALLLLHMAGSSSLSWSPVIALLRDVAEVIAPDLPGHGQSGGEPLRSIEEMTDFAFELLDALGLPSAYLAGHSMGGAVALVAARRRPARVKGLLLVSTSARLGVSPVLFDMIDQHFDDLGAFFMQLATGTEVSSPSLGTPIFPQTSQEGMRRDFAACAAFDLREQLGEISCPCAVLVGRDDVLTPPRWSERLAAALPRARLHIEEGEGHLLPRQRPRLVAEAARELLEAPPLPI